MTISEIFWLTVTVVLFFFLGIWACANCPWVLEIAWKLSGVI